ncbi:MAG: hypothetical protein ACFFEV_10775 [Candidatus Thorarchaeota archaeon]
MVRATSWYLAGENDYSNFGPKIALSITHIVNFKSIGNLFSIQNKFQPSVSMGLHDGDSD